MTTFIQLHFLTAYPPANLNRDDLGRPKTAMLGGSTRLRVSSQSLKRTWRKSDIFVEALGASLGSRTTRVGEETYKKLLKAGVADELATEVARKVAERFGKVDGGVEGEPKKKGKKGQEAAPVARAAIQTNQLVHITPHEWHLIEGLVAKVAGGHKPTDGEYDALRSSGHGAVDVALFGRMLADAPSSNVEAAAQVAHAISVHRVTVEDDFFTAVDDLKDRSDDLGAGHMGNVEFAAGVLYHYVCINRDLFLKNLDGNETLATSALKALAEAALTTSPSGKQNSFGSRARASYCLAEKGKAQPRSLVSAFLAQPRGDNVLAAAIDALTDTRKKLDDVYGQAWTFEKSFNAVKGEGTLKDVLEFVGAP